MSCNVKFKLEGSGFKNFMNCEEAFHLLNKNPEIKRVFSSRIFWGQHPIYACKELSKNQFQTMLKCIDPESSETESKMCVAFKKTLDNKCNNIMLQEALRSGMICLDCVYDHEIMKDR